MGIICVIFPIFWLLTKQSAANVYRELEASFTKSTYALAFSQKQTHMFCLELHMEFDMRTQVHTRKSPSWDYIFWLQEI